MCALVCPHATIRMKVFPPAALDGAPDGFLSQAVPLARTSPVTG